MPTFVLTFIFAATTTFALIMHHPVWSNHGETAVAAQGETEKSATQEKVTISAGFENGTLGERIEGWWDHETEDFRARVRQAGWNPNSQQLTGRSSSVQSQAISNQSRRKR